MKGRVCLSKRIAVRDQSKAAQREKQLDRESNRGFENCFLHWNCLVLGGAKDASREPTESLTGFQLRADLVECALIVAEPIGVSADAPVFSPEFDDRDPNSIRVF